MTDPQIFVLTPMSSVLRIIEDLKADFTVVRSYFLPGSIYFMLCLCYIYMINLCSA